MINDVIKEFVNATEDVRQENAYDSVAGQFDYAAPSDIKKIISATWMPTGTQIEPVSLHEFEARGGYELRQTGVPLYLTLEGVGGAYRYRLFPTPTLTSATTTINDSGGINSSDTSVILTDSSVFRAPASWFKCESEKILFQSNTASTNTLGLLRRGMGGTTAASHADTTAVTQLDWHVVYSRSAAALSGDSDVPEIHPDYHQALVYGVLSMALKTDGRNAEAAVEEGKFMMMLKRASRDAKRRMDSPVSFLLPRYY